MAHKCDWKCPAILIARRDGAYPAVWNSLTHVEQAEFEAFGDHPHPRLIARFGNWVRKMLFTKKGACPTCGRL